MSRLKSPPAWMDRILAFYCSEELFEDLQGDLYEFYYRNLTEKGRVKAQLIYLLDVLKFIRLYTVKTPKFFSNMSHFALFKSNLKASYRSILRNKLFSTINIIGLSVSMSVGLLIITLFIELNGFDTFHVKKDRIYRVHNNYTDEEGSKDFASTSIMAGKLIRDEFAGVNQVVLVASGFGIDASYEDHTIPIAGKYVSKEFADVFDFEVRHGNLARALSDPYSIAVSVSASKKLFGEENGVGKVIRDGSGKSYTINAVYADMPVQSHINVEALCSFETVEDKYKGKSWFQEWTNMWSNYVYVELEEGYDIEYFEEELVKLTERQRKLSQRKIDLKALPLTAIIPGPDMSNMGGVSFDLDILLLLVGLAAVILVSACFNYTNLSVARALRRSKEVAVRKTVGATRSHVFFQFVLEAIIVSLSALFLSIGFFFLLKPFFKEALGYQGEMLELPLTPQVFIIFILFAILTGVFAGIFPSYIMSKMQVKMILKDASNLKLFSNIGLRKGLIVFQFLLSMIFIISTLIGFRQYQYMLNFELGYETENILNMSLANNKYDQVRSELAKVPQVKDVSFSLLVPSVGSMYYEEVIDPLAKDSLQLAYNRVSENYLSLHEHKLLAGKYFGDSFLNSEDKIKMIVNEQFITHFGLGAPQKALGHEFVMGDKNGEIVGVVEDFHYGTTESELGPFLFVNGDGDGSEDFPSYYQANIKLHKSDLAEAMTAVEDAWERIDKVHTFNAKFHDEEIEAIYSFFKSLIRIMGVLAVIAISIATLGLLGMVVFTTETRLKEISIRKILGATEMNLLFLIGKSFMILMLIAGCIAVPVTAILFENFILTDYIYRPEISVAELLGGSAIILIIGTVVIALQTLWAARSNPADMLKSE